MSGENTELHRQAFDAWNRRDLDTWLEIADPEIEFAPLNLELEGGAYRGHDGIRSFWTDYLEVFPDFTVEVDEVRGAGDMTIAHIRLRGHGTGSDVPVEEPIWQVAKWRRNKCIRWRTFRSETEARKAAGLSG